MPTSSGKRPAGSNAEPNGLEQIPWTIAEAAEGIRTNRYTSVALTQALLERADRIDPHLGSYLRRFDEQALAAAAHADAELTRGIDRGPLHGIPIGIKDLLASREGPTTAQSLVDELGWPDNGDDAPAVARLRTAGAVITGKLTLSEFAIGSSKPGEFPVALNPWDPTSSPGGSSSGSAVGVAAGLFPAAIGTDTGGSIRIPAAFCGVTGLMPTFGRVPKSRCVPLSFSLDRVGPIAHTAYDCAAVLNALAGADPTDPDTTDHPVDNYLAALDGNLSGMRIGAARIHLPASTDPEASQRFETAVDVLAGLGADIIEVTLPYYDEVVAATTVTRSAEALAYHGRVIRDRWEDYSASTRSMLARGAFVSGPDYVQAQRVRRLAQEKLRALLGDVPIIVMPTVAGAPNPTGPLKEGDLEDLFARLMTRYWNLLGNPALAVPMGFTTAGLPLSLQIAGRPFAESEILRVGDAYQRATDWHQRHPADLDFLQEHKP